MSGGLYNTHKVDFDTTLDLTRLKAYGDTMNDGKVQFSFTLPVKNDEKGMEAARQLVRKMGVEEPNVALAKSLDKEFTFYVVYGSVVHTVDYENIHVQTVEEETMSMEETDEYIREHFGRKIVMIGASTGTDAHTVGIDAIMNRKGFAGHYGLERYDMIEAINMGAQVPNEEFIKRRLKSTPMFFLFPKPLPRRIYTFKTLPSLSSCLKRKACATGSSSAAAAHASPTSLQRNSALMQGSAQANMPTTLQLLPSPKWLSAE